MTAQDLVGQHLAAIRQTLHESGVDTDFMSDATLLDTIYRAHHTSTADDGHRSARVFVMNFLIIVERKRSTYE